MRNSARSIKNIGIIISMLYLVISFAVILILAYSHERFKRFPQNIEASVEDVKSHIYFPNLFGRL
jgi:hypothetical protein